MVRELWEKNAHELAAMIRARDVSSREVVTSHLARIDEVNDKLNAVTVVLEKSALAAADRADATKPEGVFHGVPFTVKENIDCVGSATTQGLSALAQSMPAADAPVVARMKAAGAIPVARTNMPEMALRISTNNPLHGLTRNPWDHDRTAGGSSGGEGAALASGMTPIGLGNDIGGSVRNPAYCCGVTSLKPTIGRLPMVPTIPAAAQPIAFRLMAVEGVLARSVVDLKTAYPVLAGWHVNDPFSVPAVVNGPDVRQKRAALVTQMPYSTLPSPMVDAVQAVGRILESAGWQVEEAVPPELDNINEIWGHILAQDLEQLASQIVPLMSNGAANLTAALVKRFDPASTSVTEVFAERDRLAIAWSEFLTNYPVVIGPTWADIPFAHDADLDPATGLDVTLTRMQFITPANALGLPAAAVPVGVADGLPTGVQVYAERWREDLCLAAAELIEASVGRITPIDPTW